MKSLYDFNYDQMAEMAVEHGWKKFRGHQIFQWLYRKRVTSIDDMLNILANIDKPNTIDIKENKIVLSAKEDFFLVNLLLIIFASCHH